jgi:hypothetical protein
MKKHKKQNQNPQKNKEKNIKPKPPKKNTFYIFSSSKQRNSSYVHFGFGKKLNTIPADISYVSPSQVLAKKL